MEVHNWASHLEHPQYIEFDTDRTPEKPDLNRFFQEGRQPSIKVQIEQCGRRSAFPLSTQGGYSWTSPVHPVPYHLPRESVSTLLDSGSKSVICLLSPWAVQTSRDIRSTEFASKKEGNGCNIKVRGVTYKPHPGHQVIETPPWHHHFHVMTTSGSLICHTTITSSHYHGTRRPSSKDLVWASSRGALDARKEDYFKINASPRIRWWWLDWGEVPSIVITGAWSRGSALNYFKQEDHLGSHE